MTVVVEDSPRNNVTKWTIDAFDHGVATGVVVSPFTTPLVAINNYKQGAAVGLDRLREGGVNNILFDPTTHALQMPSVGDFRYYDGWDLWGGVRGDLQTEASQREHLRRVFEVQDTLGVRRLAPTILLNSPTTQTSQRALDLSRIAAQICAADGVDVWLTVSGTGPFWSAGATLDAHLGAMAQLDATGWVVVGAQANATLPVRVTAEEIHGICRSVRSLSLLGPVHVSHGDLAGLPAVAAGATSLGTGWDTRQRVCAFPNYAARAPAGEGGGWFKRPTHEGILAFLSRQEALLLLADDAAFSAMIVPGGLPPDAPQEAFEHHAGCLTRLVAHLTSAPDPRAAFERLRNLYATAAARWPGVVAATGTATAAAAWIEPFEQGLAAYAHSEGWI